MKKISKQLFRFSASVLSALMLISSVCAAALAAEKTPVGYISAVPNTVTAQDVTSDPNYLIYKRLLEDESGVVSTVYNGLIENKPVIDIERYNITIDEIHNLAQVLYRSFPELWYVHHYTYSALGNIVTKVKPVYLTDSDIEVKKAAFFKAAKERYLPLVDSSMDDFTKAVTLHDALVINTYYTRDLVNGRGSNYTYMVENYGVCQYYAECYAYLLAQCGIRSEIVASDPMSHAWLKIRLDGEYYNVDSTWDDPIPDKAGHANHGYFLLSDSAIQTADTNVNRNRPHYGYRSINPANSTVYDSFDNLHKFRTQLCRVDGTFYSVSPDSKLVTYDYKTDSVTVKKELDFVWYVPDKPGYFYTSGYSSLAAYDGKLYYNSPDAVYEYDPATGESSKFADSSSSDKSLFGLRIIDDKLWGIYAASADEGYIEPSYMRDMVSSRYTVNVDDGITNGTVGTDVSEAKPGETVTLRVSPNPGYSVKNVKVSGRELTPSDGVYSFRMPSGNVTITAEFGFSDGIGARVAGYSLSLDGDIGVNFYMELDSSVAASETAYMRFTVPAEDEASAVKDVKVSDAKIKTDGGREYYIFKCNVAAKEMTSEIRAQIIDGDRLGTEYSYSVTEYAEYILAHKEVAEFAKAAGLVKAMLNYGAYSQQYFNKNTAAPANARLTAEEKELGSVTAETIGKNDIDVSLPAGVFFDGASLSLNSKTTLSLYFESTKDLSFSVNGAAPESERNDGGYVVRIRDIAADSLKDDFTVNVTSADGSGSVTYSPMNYCSRALGTSDENLKNVVKALYFYWAEADRYFQG